MAFDNGGIIENNPGGPPEEFYKNWYKNRVMPTPEGQKLLEKIRSEALERASQSVPYIYSEELKSNEAGYYDPETQQIILNKDLPEAQIEATKHHEFGHHIQAGDKFSDVLEKPHQYLVEQNIIEPKEINTGNPEWDKNLKKNFDEITNANELQQRVMTLRNECGFKPDQVVTVKDIEDCFKRKKEAGEALDPDIEDLKGVTKGNKSIVNLLNDMVSVPTSQDDMLYAKNGGTIEIEIDEADIDKYVKGGYIVEDISVPTLTRMDVGGTNTCPPDYYWNGEACVPTGRTFTAIDPNYLAEHPDEATRIQNEGEVSTAKEASDIGKLRAEFREKNPMDIFLDEKKRQFLKKNKGLNKAAGNTMEKFPEDVLQNFIKEYEYKTNNYAVNKLGKKEGWNPKRRGEWVDELTPGERDAVAESKYGSKLQPSYWSRSLAGIQELGNFLVKQLPGEQGDVFKYNIPGLTKKEQKEIGESKMGALETIAPIDLLGAGVANVAKNTGLSTGSDYKELPSIIAGEKMANVYDTDAMAFNPLTYAGLESIPELGINLAKGIGRGAVTGAGVISDLSKFVKDLKTPGTLNVLPTSGYNSFLYKSPSGAGLLVGNPNLNGSRQIFKGVTEAYNKFSRFANDAGAANLGEFKIMQQTPSGLGSSTNLVEGMTLGDMATVGQTIKTTTPALALEANEVVDLHRVQPIEEIASVKNTAPLDNQTVLQKYTSDPNVQGIASEDNLWGKEVGRRRKTTQSYNTKGQEAKNAFNKDLLNDEDYIAFKNRAAPNLTDESFGVPRATQDWKRFKTPIEDLPDDLGISAPLRDLNAEKELILTDQLELQKRFEDGVINFDEYVKTNDKLTGQLKTIDEKLNTQKIDNVKALSDNEVTANIIDDMRQNKMELWQTDEGQKRLQTMIDNTPSLKGQTPNSLMEGIGSMNNINRFYDTQLVKRNELLNEMSMYDKMYENGQISKSEYFNAQVELDEKLTIVDNNISELGDNIKHNAFYGSVNNELGISPGKFSTGELPKVTAHELGHFLGSYAGRKSGTTYLDDALKKLDLVKSESKQLEIPGLDVAEESKAHDLFGNARPNYISETLKYFDKGSEGTERVPFLAEVRQDLIDKGLIKSEYDPITPGLLKKHFDQYKGMRGEKYPLRIYDIIKDKPKNFTVMSKVLNNLPMIIGAGLMIDGLTNDDNNSNLEQAGLGLVGALLLKNPGLVKNLPKALQEKSMASILANEIAKAELIIPKVTSPLNLSKIDPIARSTVGKKSDILSSLGPEKYNEFLKYLYSQNRQAYDSPLIEFKSSKPTSYFSKDLSLPTNDDVRAFLFKEKYCLEGSECAKTSNAVTNRVFTDITGKEFEAEQNAHNAWHLEDQMTRHGGMNISPLLKQYGTELLKVGDRVLMGNQGNQSTQVAGYIADPSVRHAGFFAGYYPTQYGDIPMLFESGSGNPMFMNPISNTFTGPNSVRQVIRPRQFLDDEFGLSLVDKNIRYAYRDKPSVAIYSSDVPEVQKLIEDAEPVRDIVKKEYDITNDEFDELLISLIGIGAQETKLGAKLPGSKMSKIKIKTQDLLETVGLTQPIKKTLNTYKRVVNKATSKASDLPPYPGTSYIEMESAKLAAESNMPFDEALKIVKSKYKPKPKKIISTVEPSKGIFRQKYQTKTADLAGFHRIKQEEVANGMAQMAENYNKIKKAYPDADPRKIIDLTVLMWNSPGKAQNKELVEFYLFGKGNPDPNAFKFDYIDKVKKFRDDLINVKPQSTEDFFEIVRKSRPEIQYKEGGQTSNDNDYLEIEIDENSIGQLVNEGYIIQEL